MSADHNTFGASLLLMLSDFKFFINFKNSTENAIILNVAFLFIQNTLYKIVRILATDLQLIISFFLFGVGHIFSVIVATI